MFWKLIFISSIFFANTLAQFYEDNRCRCVCPTPTLIINSTEKSDRTLYIAFVPPNKCNCGGVVLPKVTEEIRDNAQLFCPRCECKYETRKTTVIMVGVILVLWILLLLIGYYLFLMLLECLVSKTQQSYVHNYTQAERGSEETENLLIQGEDTDS
ncbi:proton-transporting V-type ATPase complex assembly regulator TMEM9-like [Maniola jurtina]|uniref:proton-transporting V-type ATPase complex assembly regulator TMEM9-like n=1 Tax=Maniola jurtina TaxID=191418 RepID=UPI001E689EA2|nr:proton-transporting V-type ATPase complex assembly regulator TMEM9-like [Maniola jurtina]